MYELISVMLPASLLSKYIYLKNAVDKSRGVSPYSILKFFMLCLHLIGHIVYYIHISCCVQQLEYHNRQTSKITFYVEFDLRVHLGIG